MLPTRLSVIPTCEPDLPVLSTSKRPIHGIAGYYIPDMYNRLARKRALPILPPTSRRHLQATPNLATMNCLVRLANRIPDISP